MLSRLVTRAILLLTLLFFFAPRRANAADWFVAPAKTAGDGSKEKPFSDPWRALAAASAGDSIHIAQGTYFGRLDASHWIIDRPNLTILGGYDPAFKTRDPWKNPTVFAFYPDYEGSSESNLIIGLGDHSGLILDGLVIDGAGRNTYVEKPPFALRHGLNMVGPLLSFSSDNVTLRNCTLINSTSGAAEFSGESCRFENNLVLNHVGTPMVDFRAKNGTMKKPSLITGNTFAFAHDESDPPKGKGGDSGVAIRAAAACTIEKNLFALCGNSAIIIYTDPASVSINANLFTLAPRGDVSTKQGGKELLITDKNLDELEDLGIKSAQDNRAVNPAFTGLKPEWIDGVTTQYFLSYATPPKEQINALRKSYNLPAVAKPANDDERGPFAPRLDPADACSLRSSSGGVKSVELKVEFAAVAAKAAAPAYLLLTWAQFSTGDQSMDGKPVELRVALGNERNGFLLDGVTEEKFVGFDVYGLNADNDSETAHFYTVRNTFAHRQFQTAEKSNNARDSEDWYTVRGIARFTGKHQKITIEVQSISPAAAPEKPKKPRPKGRDFYVRAGSSGGDGSKEKPFRDPFQAFEKADDGDSIHIAGGDYFGKLKSGSWSIDKNFLTILGGYDADFANRDPVKNPTRLVLPPNTDKDSKSQHTGTFLNSGDICNGLTLDGLIFDGSTLNTYMDYGAIDIRSSHFAALVQLIGADMTIHACLFINGCGGGLQLGSSSGTFEGNAIINTTGTALAISAQGPGPWIIRNNLFLFSTDPTSHAATGQSSLGTHLNITGRCSARIENNIFAFADNNAIRATIPIQKLSLDNNTFAVSLGYQFTDARTTWLFAGVWDRRLADAAFLSAAQNNITGFPSGLHIDKDYADKVLPRLFDFTTRYARDDWTKIAKSAGASVAPAADASTQPAATKPKEKKEQSLDDLMGELNQLKADSAKAAEAPKGPILSPIYPWKKALTIR